MKWFKSVLKEAPTLWKCIFIIGFIISSALIVVSFILPPKGIIDPSVLKAVGEILAYPTVFSACECIFTGLGVKVTKGDTSIEVTGNSVEKD